MHRHGIKVALGVAVVAITLVLARTSPGDLKRCVSSPEMTVVSSADCRNSGSVGQGLFVWYYGGTGTRIGSPAQGGSLTAPEDDGDNGGNGDDGDDGDSGDDGGDDGSDTGGDDGGDG